MSYIFIIKFIALFSDVTGSTGKDRTNYFHHNTWMQQLPRSMPIMRPDTGYFLVEASKLAELFETPMLQRVNWCYGYLHLRCTQ